MKKPIDLNEWSYIMIKDMILRNKIAAGEQIRIENLINMLQVSRTPIREALIRLHNDGLVDVFPHVGYYVRGFSRGEYHDVICREVKVFHIHRYHCQQCTVLIASGHVLSIQRKGEIDVLFVLFSS